MRSATSPQPDLESVTDGARAAALFQHPVRQRIVALARTPMSATEMASRLGLPRQRVNYHVRQLERARFLERADQRVRRNMIEQRYVATARSSRWSARSLAPHASVVQDAASAAALFAMASRVQDDLTRVMADAGAESKRVATLSLSADIRFSSPEQRAEFTRAIETAIADVVARHTSPFAASDGTPGAGRPFRLFLGCHPIPAERSDSATEPTA